MFAMDERDHDVDQACSLGIDRTPSLVTTRYFYLSYYGPRKYKYEAVSKTSSLK